MYNESQMYKNKENIICTKIRKDTIEFNSSWFSYIYDRYIEFIKKFKTITFDYISTSLSKFEKYLYFSRIQKFIEN